MNGLLGRRPLGAKALARTCFVLAVIGACNVVQAQAAPKVIAKMAGDALEQMRSTPGYLGDRCALGVMLSENNYVTGVYLESSRRTFILGDRLLSVNNESVIGGMGLYYAALAKIPPTATANVRVERAGKTQELSVACTNARPYTEASVRILEAAAKKDWARCVTAIRDDDNLLGIKTSRNVGAYLDCGTHSGQIHPSHLASVVYEGYRLAIEEGRFDPIKWPSTRGIVLAGLSFFEQNGQPRLAAELQKQVEAVDREMANGTRSAAASTPPAADSVRGYGTGFLVDRNGAILTSHHVVAGASSIRARCGKGDPVAVTISANNQSIDIALLSSSLTNTPYLSLARPRLVAVGQKIFTYGFPVTEILGVDPKFTDGTVSALSGVGGEQSYIQISVPVQPGNSGGPVVTESGDVVGIVAAAAAIEPFLKNTGTLPQNVNWAVKAEYAALMFDAPPVQPATSSREEAIRRVERSLCLIEVR